MPKSYRSFTSRDGERDEDDVDSMRPTSPLASPKTSRKYATAQASDMDLRSRLPSRLHVPDDHSGLLDHGDGRRSYRSMPSSPRLNFKRQRSTHSLKWNESRHGSLGFRVARALGANESHDVRDDDDDNSNKLHASAYYDDRVWYDQFTSTDWVQDAIADAFRLKELKSRRDFRGRIAALYDAAQGWILVAIIGCLTASVAYVVGVTETTLFDYKSGYCSSAWYYNKRRCCEGASTCASWSSWSDRLRPGHADNQYIDFIFFTTWVVVLAIGGCLVTLQTKTVISSAISISTLDENLGADVNVRNDDEGQKDASGTISPTSRFATAALRPPMIYYPAAGSGVAEVKVILSGFIIRGFLGLKTLVFKTLGLILSVASGLSIGKEGPFVHIATCVGNVACRIFEKYRNNDAKRREILSASAASGVAVAFGAPIGGVLFSLEEVSYYFPPKTLFRTFFCCIVAALSLKALDPYGTNKIVLFEVRYLVDWKSFEMVLFIITGILGGILGALFIKASRIWARTFRRIPAIKGHPIMEVFVVALATGIVSFWNSYTVKPVAELLYELASPCNAFTEHGYGLCPTAENIPQVIWYLCVAFVVKAALTVVTFGVKVPAGIYVPSMVVGGLLGRIVGHTVQYVSLRYSHWAVFASCPANGNPESCVVPGVYALVAAGATMCGVTRLSVTLAVILFELTGSLEHVLPFSIGVLVSKWTADAIEPLSIYDLLTDMNSYPYLDAKSHPAFTGDLGDITPPLHPSRIIDVSASPLVPAATLRAQLDTMHMAGELDGGLPIVKHGILVGIVPGPDLEFALDRLGAEESDALCLMGNTYSTGSPGDARWATALVRRGTAAKTASAHPASVPLLSVDEHEGVHDAENATPATGTHTPRLDSPSSSTSPQSPLDFSPYIDPSPLALDISSSMEMVYECFSKLGLRYLCVLREGRFAGLVHKKQFVRYVKELEEGERKGH